MEGHWSGGLGVILTDREQSENAVKVQRDLDYLSCRVPLSIVRLDLIIIGRGGNSFSIVNDFWKFGSLVVPLLNISSYCHSFRRLSKTAIRNRKYSLSDQRFDRLSFFLMPFLYLSHQFHSMEMSIVEICLLLVDCETR